MRTLTLEEKQKKLMSAFSTCTTAEQRYQKIIQLGKELPSLSPEHCVVENQVTGCQSIVYLHSYEEEGRIYFSVESEALISRGLAAILIAVYSGETAETILKYPPNFLDALSIGASLTPGRANGLYSIHLRMQQDALKHLMG